MKFYAIVAVFFLTSLNVFAQSELSSVISKHFFQPIEMERLAGSFNGYYKVEPGDGIPYKEIAFFDNPVLPLKYYSNAKSNSGRQGSVLSLYGQEFNLGNLETAGPANVDIDLDSVWWKFVVGGKTYICSLAGQAGADAYTYILILFDISDIDRVVFSATSTFSFDDHPLIGFFPAGTSQVCFLRTTHPDNFVTAPYRITDHGLEPLAGINGKPYDFEFAWSKWKSEELTVIHSYDERR